MRFMKEELSPDGLSMRWASPPLNLLEMIKDTKDRTMQVKKRIVKPKWLIRNIPKGGAKAMEILKDRKK